MRHFFYYLYKQVRQACEIRLGGCGTKTVLFDGWARIYLTLKCNLNCSYCVNEFVKNESAAHLYKSMGAQQWGELINKMGRPVVITGGEPFVYRFLPEVVNSIDEKIAVKIYTNYTIDPSDFVAKVKRKVHFFGSYHPCSGDSGKILENISLLKDSGFTVEIHSIVSALRNSEYRQHAAKFKKIGIKLALDLDQNRIFESSSQRFRKRVRCIREIILVAPDGQRYPCVSRMIRKKGGMEDLKNMPLSGDSCFSICHDFGYCAPCDGLGVYKVEHLN